ncbi:MAG TPA: hypothetical protein VF840_02060 [Terriglobales bacterium]
MYFVPMEGRAFGAILKVSSDGNRITRFELNSVPGFQNSHISEYTVLPDGTVFVLAGSRGEPYVLKFSSDGRFSSRIRLDIDKVIPMQLAAFDSDTLLVAGRLVSPAGPSRFRPFVGIFNSSGQLVRQVTLRGDLRKDASDVVEGNERGLDADEAYAAALDMSAAETGDDRNVYLARPGWRGPIFVISPTGEMVKKFFVPGPTPKASLGSFKVSRGQVAVQFVEANPDRTKSSRVTFSVFDASTGKKIREYSVPEEIRLGFACYSQDEMAFVGGDKDQRLRITWAAPR